MVCTLATHPRWPDSSRLSGGREGGREGVVALDETVLT